MNGVLGNSLGLLEVFTLVLLNGFFVAAEFALVSVSARRARLDQLANEGNRAAKRVQMVIRHLDTYIAATQLGITMASLGLGYVGEPAMSRLLEPLFRFLPGKGAVITSHAVAIAAGFILVTSIHIVLGELVPKSAAIQRSEGMALLLAGPLSLFARIFKPFITVLSFTGNAILRLIGLRPVAGGHSSVHSVEELELLVHSTREAGLLEAQQERMVSGVFDFKDTVVRKIMTPRLDITALEADADAEELIRLVNESGHSRFPVYDDDLDNIVGVLHVKDVLKSLVDSPESLGIRESMRPAYFVPENKRASFLLTELRRNKLQMAIVRDEYGTVTGVVTIEDLLEEIVGEIQDEYDVEEPQVQVIDSTTSILDGRMSLSDVNDRMGLNLPEEEADTIGGFVFGLLGHQAEQGERVRWENVEFVVEATDGRRIQKVRLIYHPEPGDDVDFQEANAAEEVTADQTVQAAPQDVETTPDLPLRR
jgi:CBS domain containing-hemolysin-like protein